MRLEFVERPLDLPAFAVQRCQFLGWRLHGIENRCHQSIELLGETLENLQAQGPCPTGLSHGRDTAYRVRSRAVRRRVKGGEVSRPLQGIKAADLKTEIRATGCAFVDLA